MRPALFRGEVWVTTSLFTHLLSATVEKRDLWVCFLIQLSFYSTSNDCRQQLSEVSRKDTIIPNFKIRNLKQRQGHMADTQWSWDLPTRWSVFHGPRLPLPQKVDSVWLMASPKLFLTVGTSYCQPLFFSALLSSLPSLLTMDSMVHSLVLAVKPHEKAPCGVDLLHSAPILTSLTKALHLCK